MTPSAARNKSPGAMASNDGVRCNKKARFTILSLSISTLTAVPAPVDDELWAAVDGTPFVSDAAASNEELEVPRPRAASPARQPLPRELPATPCVSPPPPAPPRPAVEALGSGTATPNSSVGSGWTRTSGSTYIPNPPRDNVPSSSSGGSSSLGGGGGSSGGSGGGGGGGGGGGIPSCGNCGYGVEGHGTGVRYYCITRGRAVGVVVGWINVSPLVTGVPYAAQQRYPTFALALAAFHEATERGQVHLVL
ncbi:hypothetical protein FOMPIDRAFT_1044731 [Fomitopsis schrenkii]|uniref:Uncharacterized protein n=1 Tax=Fomitopsis schrenkii TaxID=2126942 RepID=S8FWA5_FOMSC|nr:hypothetical protein FOMPIDRAFT_1044731 [Fomitopsis schrenkii]